MQQRLVEENAPLGGKRPIFLAKDPPIAHCPLTLGNVGGSPTPGNHTAETGLAGWGARIRTWEWRNQNPQNALGVLPDACFGSFPPCTHGRAVGSTRTPLCLDLQQGHER